MTIAVVAVVTTGWLATRTTSDRIVGQFTRSLEAEAFVYSQLATYAGEHRDWDDVSTVVEELAERTGRRIALTTPDGAPLADSASVEGGDGRPLPEVPAALIDPIAPFLAVAGDVSERVTSSPSGGPATGVALTDTEREELRRHAEDRAACIDPRGLPREAIASRSGTHVTLDRRTADARLVACEIEGLDEATSDALLLRHEINRVLTSCLDRKGIPHTLVLDTAEPAPAGAAPDGDGPGTPGVPAVGVDVAAQPDDATERQAADACGEGARREILTPFVAGPAVLYLDDAEGSDGALSVGGGSRTLGAVALVLAMTIGATVLAGRRLVTPLRSLTEAAQRLESGDHDSRVAVGRDDEIGRLGAAFNAMATTLQRNDRQRRAIVSDVAHELRSPLTNLRGHLEAAYDGVVDVDDDLIASLLDESVLLQRLVDDLQQLATADTGALQLHLDHTDVADLLTNVAHAHRASADTAEVTVTVDVPATLRAVVDADRLRQAMGNLVTNALRYTPPGGTVVLRSAAADDGTITLTVEDTGAGIAPEHLPYVFDRFFRIDASRSRETGGTGLGLAITRTLVEAHGGTIDVASTLGRGSMFKVWLPRTDAPPTV